MTPFRPSRRELIRWAAATSVLSGLPFGCGKPAPAAPWKPVFLTTAEVELFDALADTVLPPDADGSRGGRALGAASFVDHLLSALDGAPKIHAAGPFSGRAPLSDNDGRATALYPPDGFSSFEPLDRYGQAIWQLRLFGSAGLTGGAPNEALLGAVSGLQADVRALIAHAGMLAPDLSTRPLEARLAIFNQLTEDQRDLCVELVSQAAWSAPEYGGNAGTDGWKLIHFEGDSQPLGYSLWDDPAQTYRERPEAPMSTANPGADPEPMDGASKDLIETVVKALGGRIAS